MKVPRITPDIFDVILGAKDLRRKFQYDIMRTDPLFAVWVDGFIKEQWNPGNVSMGFGVGYECHFERCYGSKIKILPLTAEGRAQLEEELRDTDSFVFTALPEFQRAQPDCFDRLLTWCSEQPLADDVMMGVLLAHRLFALLPDAA